MPAELMEMIILLDDHGLQMHLRSLNNSNPPALPPKWERTLTRPANPFCFLAAARGPRLLFRKDAGEAKQAIRTHQGRELQSRAQALEALTSLYELWNRIYIGKCGSWKRSFCLSYLQPHRGHDDLRCNAR